MLITIHNLPMNTEYSAVKSLIIAKCGLEDSILGNLQNEGTGMQVTVGVAGEKDAAILVKNINGLNYKGRKLFVEDKRKKKSEQPSRSHIVQQPQYVANQPPAQQDYNFSTNLQATMDMYQPTPNIAVYQPQTPGQTGVQNTNLAYGGQQTQPQQFLSQYAGASNEFTQQPYAPFIQQYTGVAGLNVRRPPSPGPYQSTESGGLPPAIAPCTSRDRDEPSQLPNYQDPPGVRKERPEHSIGFGYPKDMHEKSGPRQHDDYHGFNASNPRGGHASMSQEMRGGHSANSRDIRGGHSSLSRDMRGDHSVNLRDMRGGQSSTSRNMRGGHSVNSRDIRGGHSSISRDMRGDHSANSHDIRGGHSSMSRDMRGDHFANLSDMRGGHFSTSQDTRGGHSANSRDIRGGHSSMSRDMRGDHSANLSDMRGGHSSTSQDTSGGHSANSRDIRGGHSSMSRDMRGDHSANLSDMRGGHSSTSQDMRDGHSVNSRDIRGDHSSMSRDMRDDHSANLPDMRGGHSSSLRDMRRDYFSNSRDMRGGHSSPSRDMRGDHSANSRALRGGRSSMSHDMRGDHSSMSRDTRSGHSSNLRDMRGGNAPHAHESRDEPTLNPRKMRGGHSPDMYDDCPKKRRWDEPINPFKKSLERSAHDSPEQPTTQRQSRPRHREEPHPKKIASQPPQDFEANNAEHVSKPDNVQDNDPTKFNTKFKLSLMKGAGKIIFVIATNLNVLPEFEGPSPLKSELRKTITARISDLLTGVTEILPQEEILERYRTLYPENDDLNVYNSITQKLAAAGPETTKQNAEPKITNREIIHQQQKEMKTFKVNPSMQKAIDEEIHLIGKVLEKEFNCPQTMCEQVVYSEINHKDCIRDCKRLLSYHVARRITDSGLKLIRVLGRPKPPKYGVLEKFLSKYRCLSLKKPVRRAASYTAAFDSFATVDELCNMKSATIGDQKTLVNFKYMSIAPKKKKLYKILAKRERRDYVCSLKEYSNVNLLDKDWQIVDKKEREARAGNNLAESDDVIFVGDAKIPEIEITDDEDIIVLNQNAPEKKVKISADIYDYSSIDCEVIEVRKNDNDEVSNDAFNKNYKTEKKKIEVIDDWDETGEYWADIGVKVNKRSTGEDHKYPKVEDKDEIKKGGNVSDTDVADIDWDDVNEDDLEDY